MVNYSPAASGNKHAEFIRVLMPVIIIVIIYLVLKKMGHNLLEGIKSPFISAGLADTAEEKTATAKTAKSIIALEDNPAANPFNPEYYHAQQKRFGIALTTTANAKAIALQIANSVKTFVDEPAEALAGFKKLNNKCKVSQVSEQFAKVMGQDMLSNLQYHFDTTAQKIILGQIINYVNSLPVGKS